ncbi:MAG TPA: hypothetical protein VEC60_00525 [Reyranella sp.]|nr:hypothetical protein [Reyranella sp.]
MTSGELAILVLVGTGAVAGSILYFLWSARRPPADKALNESIVAQQWAGGLDHTPPTTIDLPTHHGGIDGG